MTKAQEITAIDSADRAEFLAKIAEVENSGADFWTIHTTKFNLTREFNERVAKRFVELAMLGAKAYQA